jgi:hypothetical protein
VPGTASKPETTLEYLNNHGYSEDYIAIRFRDMLRYLQDFINITKIAKKNIQNIDIDMDLLKKAVIDYFVDTVRIKEFHDIPKTRTEKIYAYTAYWLLKRKPIQIKRDFEGSLFINELFIFAYLLSGILAEKNLIDAKCVNIDGFIEFQELLFYNLKYRQVTQQSLELMIKAFYSGCDFLPNAIKTGTLKQ